MIISSKAIERISQILYGSDAAKRAEAPQAQQPLQQDKVTLSPQGKEIQALQRRLAETPEVRQERVAALKAAIERGEYHVPAEKIAERMLEHKGKL